MSTEEKPPPAEPWHITRTDHRDNPAEVGFVVDIPWSAFEEWYLLVSVGDKTAIQKIDRPPWTLPD